MAIKDKLKAGIATTIIGIGGIGISDISEFKGEPIEFTPKVYEMKERVEQRLIDNVVEVDLPWKGEKGIKIKKDFTPTLSEKLKDKRSKQPIIDRTTFNGEDGIKFDIILSEKPDTNRFCYQVEGWEDYNWWYQPSLTEEELEAGAERPEDIVGSYAVYHKTKRDHIVGQENYETGKAFHIPRPQVWEVGKKEKTAEWAELSFDEGELCVTADEDYLKKAKYPVRVDPTFGYTSGGASLWSYMATNGANYTSYRWGIASTASEDGTVTSISVYGQTDEASASTLTTFVAINQKDSEGTSNHGIIGSGEGSLSFPTSKDWRTVTGLSIPISNGITYVINSTANSTPLAEGKHVYFYYDSDAGSEGVYYEPFTNADGTTAYNTAKAESPWVETIGFAGTYNLSIYATYSLPTYNISTINGVDICDISTWNGTTLSGISTWNDIGFKTCGFDGFADWGYRVKITVDSADVDATLSNFPVYVDLSDLPAGFWSNVDTDGDDIRVAESDGTTETAFEIVDIDTGGNTGELHFLADSLSSSVDTDFYIYYGNAGASAYAEDATYGSENVWDNVYAAVYHYEEAVNTTADGYNDATENDNDGTGVSMALTEVAGQMGIAQDFDGSADYITDSSTTNIPVGGSARSITAWVDPDSITGQRSIVHIGNSTNQRYIVQASGLIGGNYYIFTDGVNSGNNQTTTGGGIIDTSPGYQYYAFTKDASDNFEYYLDGVSRLSGTFSITINTNNSNVTVGDRLDYGTQLYDGYIDEVRISTNDLSDEWIDAEYTNQNTPSGFYTVGTQETP